MWLKREFIGLCFALIFSQTCIVFVDLSVTSNSCVVEQNPSTLILLYDICAFIVKWYNSPFFDVSAVPKFELLYAPKVVDLHFPQ